MFAGIMDGIGFGAGGGFDGTFWSATDVLGLASAASLDFCLDAGDALSWDDGVDDQTWFNRETAPGAFDFYRGDDGTAQAADPTFNGTVGNKSSSEYWSFDGGDYLGRVSGIVDYHKDGKAWTCAAWLYIGSSATWDIMSNMDLYTNSNGISFGLLSGALRVRVGDSTSTAVLNVSADSTTSTSAWHFVAVSIDDDGTGFFFEDGAYKQVSSSNTFDATYISPTASGNSYGMNLFSHGNQDSPAPSGSRLAGCWLWGSALSFDQINSLYDMTKGRFGL
jgi:hypothetical protein